MRQHPILDRAGGSPDVLSRPEEYGRSSFARSSPEGDYRFILHNYASDDDLTERWMPDYFGQTISRRVFDVPTGEILNFLISAVDWNAPFVKLASEGQRKCEQAIQNLLDIAGTPNWDGEGADPVSEAVVEIAQRVVDELPADVDTPLISADPQGNVDFDWHLENGTMFTISIGKEGDIAISGLHQDREDRLSALEKDSQDPIPPLLSYGLHWLRKMKGR